MRLHVLTLALVSATAFTACGGDDDDDLKPASEAFTATAERQASVSAGAKVLELGQSIELVKGVKVTVSGAKDVPQPKRTEPLRWVEISLRIDNSSSDSISRPGVNVTCDGASSGAGYVYPEAGAKDLYSLREVPAKSFAEAVVLMGVPKPCANGRISIGATGAFVGEKPKPGLWRLP